jgi:hypothetical protein
MSLRDYHRQARVESAESLLRAAPPAKIEPVALAMGWRSRKDLYRAVRTVGGVRQAPYGTIRIDDSMLYRPASRSGVMCR